MTRSKRTSLAILAVCALLLTFTPTFALAQAATPAQAPAPVLEAKFEKSLDTKSAKVGDTVTAKTLRPIKLPDGSELPKGAKLVAKVITVLSKKEGNGNSMLTFRFDEADLKGGTVVPIHGSVVAIGPSLAPKDGLGANSVLGRSTTNTSGVIGGGGIGTGSTTGLDPNAGLGSAGAKDEDDIPLGSTLEGVALGVHKDADWTTALQGFKCDIKLGSDVDIKVQLK